MWETWVRFLGWEDALEKGKATHSSILAWRIPWTVCILYGVAKSQTWLSDFHFHYDSCNTINIYKISIIINLFHSSENIFWNVHDIDFPDWNISIVKEKPVAWLTPEEAPMTNAAALRHVVWRQISQEYTAFKLKEGISSTQKLSGLQFLNNRDLKGS